MSHCLLTGAPSMGGMYGAKWQSEWNKCVNNKLYAIQPAINEKIHCELRNRRDHVVFSRCLIGHSRLTHVHYMKQEPRPLCQHCQDPLSVKHILIGCAGLNRIRIQCFDVPDLKTLFRNTDPNLILAFLRG